MTARITDTDEITHLTYSEEPLPVIRAAAPRNRRRRNLKKLWPNRHKQKSVFVTKKLFTDHIRSLRFDSALA